MDKKKRVVFAAVALAVIALLLALMPGFVATATDGEEGATDAVVVSGEGTGGVTDPQPGDGEGTGGVTDPQPGDGEGTGEEDPEGDESDSPDSEVTNPEDASGDAQDATDDVAEASVAEADEVATEAVVEEEPALEEPALEEAATPTLKWKAHIQTYGDKTGSSDATTTITLGTTGQSKRIEAVSLALEGIEGGGITYRTHVQRVGWQGWVSDGALAGTTGRSLRVEAIQIKLTGKAAEDYDVYYRAHVQRIGWMNWASNGNEAGTAGMSLRVEAIQIVLVPKGGTAPSGSGRAYVSAPNVSYQAHVQRVGWQGYKSNGATGGTTGRSLRVEALRIKLSGSNLSGGITYRTHVQRVGWQGWVSNDALAGTTGQSLRVEAIEIKLTGEMATYFDVYYRTHVQSYGWLGWAKNGATSGTTGASLRVEAVQIKLVPKGGSAPGSTANAYMTMSPAELRMWRKAQDYSSPTSYLVLVDVTNCRVGIFHGSRGHWTLVKFWRCTCGRSNRPTCIGTYYIGAKGYSFGHGPGQDPNPYTCYYYTQFNGDYLFHSVLYYWQSDKIRDGRLGQHLSAGCVRLDISNAKWLQDNVPYKSKVVTYL